jgi:hypothetical protein
MPEIAERVLNMEIPLYGLPEGTDLQDLVPKVRDLAASLEEMGVFDQREYPPAHVLVIPGRGDGL